jgi:nicotinamide-nucleotide amidase
MLAARSMTLAVAESCTGGLLGSRITDVAGASGYFLGGVVSYSDEAKRRVLSVDPRTLDDHGAVSREVARQMAEGVRELLRTDVGLATTGIMGPGGGTDEKPVGTFWMALAAEGDTETAHVRLTGDRGLNKQRAAAAALDLLRRWLDRPGG